MCVTASVFSALSFFLLLGYVVWTYVHARWSVVRVMPPSSHGGAVTTTVIVPEQP